MTYTIESAIEALQSGDATIEEIAKETGWPVVQDCLVPEPDIWYADDGNAEIAYDGTDEEGHEPKVDSADEAAQKYVDTGDWGDDEGGTSWVTVWTWREGIDEAGDSCKVDRESHDVEIEPAEPKCISSEGHDWQSPYEIVGGIEENPGVWGHGGGVTIHVVCMRCGCEKLVDTWAQNPNNGRQGLTSVRYEAGKYESEISDAMRKRVEFSVEHSLNADQALVIAKVGDLTATYVVCAEEGDSEEGYSYSDTDTWPLSGDWPDPPSSLIDEARELADGWEGI